MLSYKHSNLFFHLWNNRFLTPDGFVHNIVAFFSAYGCASSQETSGCWSPEEIPSYIPYFYCVKSNVLALSNSIVSFSSFLISYLLLPAQSRGGTAVLPDKALHISAWTYLKPIDRGLALSDTKLK